MNREEQWLLPEGVEEILPAQAAVIENLRRRLLDLYVSWGYELVVPPLIEFLDPLLNGAGRDLEDQTFRITDQMSGRLMGVRADITPQVARMDAHTLRRRGPARLCYCNNSARTRPALPGASRLPYQIGVELFGHAGMESDYEVMSLLLETLGVADVADVTLDLGHVGIFGALVAQAGLSQARIASLEDIYQRKAAVELETFIEEAGLDGDLGAALGQLPWLSGSPSVLEDAREQLSSFGDEVTAALDELGCLAARLQEAYPGVSLHLDLGELRGYHYHTGCVFVAWVDGHSEPFAKGGRYDHIGEVFGRARPATGFSADLKRLAAVQPAFGPRGVFVPETLNDAETVAEMRRLRDAGQRVVAALPGADNDPVELGCDRQLVRDNGTFRVTKL